MNNVKLDFSLQDMAGKTFQFRTLRELVKFSKDEIAKWERLKSKRDEPVRRHVSCDASASFQDLINQASVADNNQVEGETPNERSARVTATLVKYRSSGLQRLSSHWLSSTHPFVALYLDIHSTHGYETAAAFLVQVTKNQFPDIRQAANFRGILLAFEFQQLADKTRKKSLQSLDESLDSLSKRYEESACALFTDSEQRIESLENATIEGVEKSRTLHEEQAKLFQEKSEGFETAFEESCTSWRTRIAELESLYTEKLRFSSPATYWEKSAKKYYRSGAIGLVALLIAVSIGIFQFYSLFTTWLQGKDIALQLNTLQGIVLFASVAALYAFVIKVLARITFSAFHLMRDAQEREQLTHLYIALSNESEMDKDSRDIVLQALFSRTDTGLLGADSAPTMPTGSEFARLLAQSKGN